MKTHVVWLCVAIAALALGTQFSTNEPRLIEKPTELLKTKETIVKKPIERIKEVEKRVEVSEDAQKQYLASIKFAESFFNADWFVKDEILKGISGVQVNVVLQDKSKSKITERELTDLIELSLRKNGVPVRANSSLHLEFIVSGLFDPQGVNFAYTATLSLTEAVPIFRSPGFKIAPVVIWTNGYTGHVGSQNIGNSVTSVAEKVVVSFSNAYLAANPK